MAQLSSRIAFFSKGFTLVARPLACSRLQARAMSSSPYSKPTIEVAKTMPRYYSEMPIDVIVTLACQGDFEASKERLSREIMVVDNVTWDEAQPMVAEIHKINKAGSSMITLPYKMTGMTAVAAALASFPLCFHLGTALWFNELMVTTEIPGKEDLETVLEVGSWTWNWMEPPLGQISFVLLCFQYARDQMAKIGLKPYTDHLIQRRAQRLADQFPQYSHEIVMQFSETDSLN